MNKSFQLQLKFIFSVWVAHWQQTVRLLLPEDKVRILEYSYLLCLLINKYNKLYWKEMEIDFD